MKVFMRLLPFLLPLFLWATPAFAEDERVVKIYHDTDWLNNVQSSESIWRGMEIALAEVGSTVNGTRVELIKKNHSGNVTRSLRNMKQFLNDDQALAVFSGMHSPPLITNRDFINKNNIPVLVPWAAGGPITRYPSVENSIFRLSVDDTKAGAVMVAFARSQYQCSSPYLLLENTPWGDSNARSIKKALDKSGAMAAGTKRFDWSMKSHVARSIISDVVRQGAECVIMVASSAEGAQIALSMGELEEASRIPIISHWGITGGNFHETVDSAAREKIDLSFIQTCFSFMDTPLPSLAQKVFEDLKAAYPDDIAAPKDIEAPYPDDIGAPKNIESPVGFIHAYDLMKVFIAALENVELTGNMTENRKLLKAALETLDTPVEGLVKTYNKPFTQFSLSNPDAHEALGEEDICMASYGAENEILIYQNRERSNAVP